MAYIDECLTLTGLTLREAFDKLREDFPQTAIKERRGSGGSLSSIKPAYRTERVSEVFGLCGIGWDFGHDGIEVMENDRIVRVWFRYAYIFKGGIIWSERIYSHGMGNVHKGMTDGDARKSAVTDGLTKTVSMIGVGISVFKGEQSHTGRRPPAQQQPPKQQPPKQNPQKKADTESSPASQLWAQKAKPANVPPEEWKLWCKEYGITKDKRTQGKKKIELLEKKIAEWTANSRSEDERLFISEDEIAWLKSTAEASAIDIQGEEGLLKFCRATISNFEVKKLKHLTKDEFDQCMTELNERSAGEES